MELYEVHAFAGGKLAEYPTMTEARQDVIDRGCFRAGDFIYPRAVVVVKHDDGIRRVAWNPMHDKSDQIV